MVQDIEKYKSYILQRQEVECQIEESQEYLPRDHPCEKWSTKEQVKAEM